MMGDDALFNLRWDAQRSALLGSMASLYREEAFVDTTIVADNKIFKAHKLLLSASSSYLRSILESVPASQHAVICMPQVSSIDMGNLLRFIYEGQIKISRRSLRPFLATAKLLRIKGMDFELNDELEVSLPPQHHNVGSLPSPINHSNKQYHQHGTKRPAPPPNSNESASCGSGNNNTNNSGTEDASEHQPASKRASPNHDQDELSRATPPGTGGSNNEDQQENGNLSKNKGSTGSGASSPSHNNNNNNNNNDNNNSNSSNVDRLSSRSVGGESIHGSEMDTMMGCSGGEDESNHSSSMEPLQLISLSRLAAANALANSDNDQALNLVEHGDHHRMMLGDHHHERDDRDDVMSNGGHPDYDDDDDEDNSFTMSIQPEVSLRESDESYSVHSGGGGDRRSHLSSPHSALEIKHVPNLLSTNAFGGLPLSAGTGLSMSASGGSSVLHNLNALKNLNKLRPLIPKAHQSSSAAAAASQFMSEGILMRMMRGEPPHLGHGAPSGTSGSGAQATLNNKPGGSSSSPSSVLSHHASSFFDLGHGDAAHHGGAAGLRKQKRYVQCTSCSKVLSSLSALKRHMEDVHCARIQGKCLLCGRVYSSRNSLLTHVYSAHKKHHDYKAVARIIRESDFEQFATA